MLLIADKVFLSIVFILSFPSALLVTFILGDFTLFTILCVYAAFATRLVSSDCIFIKSLGYGVASAPLLLLLDTNGSDTMG